MKDSNGYFTMIVWVKEKVYNEKRYPPGWDYKVQGKDDEENWIGEECWRPQKCLGRAH